MARHSQHQRQAGEPGGLWHQPALMSLLADLLIVLATAALAWAALITLQRLPLFPLRELVLTQVPGKLSADQLEHAARSSVTGNFFTIDLEATRNAFEKLPWVRRATLQRQWPHGLTLTLEEHEAKARWRFPNGNAALVNHHGEVFSADLTEDTERLPLLSGPEGSAMDLLKRHDEFSQTLAAIGRRAEAITLSTRLAWQVRLDDGVTIELGRDQEQHPLSERLARFAAHYDSIRNRTGKIQVADMRYPNGFALTSSGKPVATTGRKS